MPNSSPHVGVLAPHFDQQWGVTTRKHALHYSGGYHVSRYSGYTLYRGKDKPFGQGGMATVFKAYQPGLDRAVALKILPPLLAQQPDFVARFAREAKAIAKLNHPHILPVFDFGQVDSYSFLVMRYIEGATTLKEVMKQPLTLAQVADLMGQVALALDYAHEQGIIHRDVKPANVLMAGEWALLSDFGLAKMTEASVKLTGSGVGVGTPAYMSPEQGQGRPVDQRTDIYALGIILFEMLTGQIPHDAETPFGIVLKRATEPLPLPRSLNPQIPEGVERVILKALALNPADRFERAGGLAEALKRAVSDLSLDLERPTVASGGLKPPSGAAPAVGTSEALTVPRPREPEPGLRQKIAAFLTGPEEARELRNRQALLKLVQDFWIKGVLENSLHGAALLELGLETRPETVAHPWQTVLQTSTISLLSIPVGTKMIDVFAALGALKLNMRRNCIPRKNISLTFWL